MSGRVYAEVFRELTELFRTAVDTPRHVADVDVSWDGQLAKIEVSVTLPGSLGSVHFQGDAGSADFYDADYCDDQMSARRLALLRGRLGVFLLTAWIQAGDRKGVFNPAIQSVTEEQARHALDSALSQEGGAS